MGTDCVLKRARNIHSMFRPSASRGKHDRQVIRSDNLLVVTSHVELHDFRTIPTKREARLLTDHQLLQRKTS